MEAECDVDEDGKQGQQHGDNCAAGDVTGDGRTNLVGGDDTVGVLQGGGEVGKLDVLCIEALEGVEEEAFDLCVNSGALVVVLVLGGDLHLGVSTELLYLDGVLVDAFCLCSSLEHILYACTHVFCGDGLVKADHIGTAAGEVYTVAEALECDGSDGDEDEDAGDGVGPLLCSDEVCLGILENILGELVGEGYGLACLDAVIEDDAGDEDGGKNGSDDTDDEGGGKALDRTGTKDVEDDTGDEGCELTVDDCGVSVLVTVCNGEGESLACSQLFLDTLIDDNVGIHSHTQCKDETGDTREGKDGAEAYEDTEEEENVAEQSHVGNETGALVEEYHVDEHQAECDDEGDETGPDGCGTEGRTYNLLLNDGGRCGKLTALEDVCKVLGFLDVEVAGDFGRTAGNFTVDGRIGVHETVEDDGNLLTDVVLGEVSPDGSAFSVHCHGYGRSAAAAVLCAVEVDAGVGDYTAVKGSLAVTGVDLDGNQFVEVAALDEFGGLYRPHSAETLGKDILCHCQVAVYGNGIDTLCEADAGVVPAAGAQNPEEGICNCGGVAEVAENLAYACIDGVEVYLVALEGGPEFEGCGALEELAHTLRILDTRKFDEDLAGVAYLLDVGLGDTEAVDTVTEHVEGVVDSALRLCADNLDDLVVGGVVGDLVAEFIGRENLCETAAGSHFLPSFTEQADEVCAGVDVVLLCFGHGGYEVRVCAASGEGPDQVFKLDLQHDVHTALEVQTKVDFLFLGALVGVSEEYLFRADGINISPVPDV